MSPSHRSLRVPAPRVPRASGDEPEIVEAHNAAVDAPVFPARAGMSPGTHEHPKPNPRVPRASGDEPPYTAPLHARGAPGGCSPRERG